MLSLLLASLTVYLNHQLSHVVIGSTAPLDKLFKLTDVHEFTGHLEDTVSENSTISGHCDNGTVADYTLEALTTMVQGGVSRYNLTTMIGGYRLYGTLTIEPPGSMHAGSIMLTDAQPFTPSSRRVQLELGPNPPPPPPTCETSYDKGTCNGVSGCSWCASNDGIHTLCFSSDALPPASSWNCGA